MIIEWIDIIYEKEDISDRNSDISMVLQAYDPLGELIFEKTIEATYNEAQQTIRNFNKGMPNSELYDYR